MKALVCVKRVLDYHIRAHAKSDGTDVDLSNQKMSINPFDEIAVEEAVRLKEKNVINDIYVLSIGPKASTDVIRTALSLGADHGIHVEYAGALPPLMVAKIIAWVAQKIAADLIILGKQAIDNDFNQTGQMVAGILDWPQGTFISQCTITDRTVQVSREVDGGTEVLNLTLPAVLTTDLRLNTPRYPKLPNIMKAKQKELTVYQFDQLGLTLSQNYQVIRVHEPPARTKGRLVNSVDELINCLKNEAKVI